jgi:hypothetical protein
MPPLGDDVDHPPVAEVQADARPSEGLDAGNIKENNRGKN